jgi:hypothetical protein
MRYEFTLEQGAILAVVINIASDGKVEKFILP